MASEALQSGVSTGAGSDQLGRLCANMAEGLHAMAQPLTILRSAVAACNAPGIAEGKQRRYLELSIQQVERACSLFECLQDLVIANQTEADREPFDLPELLTAMVEDRKAEFQTSGVELRLVMPSSLQPVLGDVSRTLQAILAALKIAVSFSSSGEVLELAVTTRDGSAELILQNSRTYPITLDSPQRLSLALAEANIRSQQGKYVWREDPFIVSLSLPLWNSE
jgi:hypothetical protein